MPTRASAKPDDHARVPSDAVDLGHLTGLLGYALRRAQVAAFRNFNRRFADLDIRPSQLGILTVVARNPGLKQSQIGAALGIKRANLVPLLNGLEGRGLVARTRASRDRRSHALQITPDGETLLAELMRREVAHEAEIAARIDERERERLLALLVDVREACDAAVAPDEDETAQTGPDSRATTSSGIGRPLRRPGSPG